MVAIPSTERSHTAIAERLRPWLALANLVLPTTQEIAPPAQAPLSASMSTHSAYSYKIVFETAREVFRRARQVKEVRLFITYAAAAEEDKREREFYEIFFAVRSILNQLLAREERPDDYRYWELRALSPVPLPGASPLKPVEITCFGGGPLTEEIHIQDGRDAKGKPVSRLKFSSSSLLQGFQDAFRDVELARLRRCPVCTGFYYAVRENKGACDNAGHLVLVRTWNHRKKTPEYRENWRINKLVKSGFPLSKARAAIVSRKKARNSIMRGD